MRVLFNKILNNDDAERLIEYATAILFCMVLIKAVAILTIGNKQIVICVIETILIILIRKYKSQIACIFLILFFVPPIIIQSKNMYFSGIGLDILIEYSICIFLGIRSLQAAFKLNPFVKSLSAPYIIHGYKIYFWFFVLINIGLFYLLLHEVTPIDIVNLILTLIGVIAFYGFVFKVPILNRQFWKIYFPISVLWYLFNTIFFLYLHFLSNALNKLPLLYVVEINILIFLVSLPYYIGLYLYGYNAEEIWLEKST